jgi:hypothetical protein
MNLVSMLACRLGGLAVVIATSLTVLSSCFDSGSRIHLESDSRSDTTLFPSTNLLVAATDSSLASQQQTELSNLYSNSPTQVKSPQTVRDFWMLKPTCGEKIDSSFTEKIEIYDPEHNYLKTYAQKGYDISGERIFVLFPKSDGRHILAIASDVNLNSVDLQDTCFLEYRDGKWIDVITEVVPQYNDDPKLYRLPRRGKTIEVFESIVDVWAIQSVESQGKKLYDLVWQGDKFVIK